VGKKAPFPTCDNRVEERLLCKRWNIRAASAADSSGLARPYGELCCVLRAVYLWSLGLSYTTFMKSLSLMETC
jgi:hypothetical protein